MIRWIEGSTFANLPQEWVDSKSALDACLDFSLSRLKHSTTTEKQLSKEALSRIGLLWKSHAPPPLSRVGGGSSSNENGIFTLVCLLSARGEIWTQASREQLENYLTWNKQHRREFAPSLFLFTDVIAVIFLINAINNWIWKVATSWRRWRCCAKVVKK